MVINKLWMGGFAISALLGTLVFGLPVLAQGNGATTLEIQVQDTLKSCFQCHGEGAVSLIPSHPTIAGQKAEYLERQLRAFKQAENQTPADDDGDGDEDPQKTKLSGRTDSIMGHMAAGLPDHLIAPVARALSQLACDGGTPKAKRTNLLTLPDAAKKCVICHGEDGIGKQGYIPNLAGQQRSYLRRHLLLIRETAWGAQPREGEAWRSHPIMESQTARIKIADIDAMTHYFSALDCRGAQAAQSPAVE